MDLIFNPNKFFYDLIAIFANLIDVAVSVCNKICGIPDEAGNNLIQNFFDEQIVGYIFLALGTIAVIFGLCVAMAETMRTKSEEGVTVLQPYADYGKGMLWMLGILAAFPLFILIIGIIGGIILEGLNGDLTLGEQILRNCFDTSEIKTEDINDWSSIWEGVGAPSWADIKGANKDVAGTFNAWIGLLGVGVITFPLIGIVVYMAKRLINIILLYAVAPISFGLYPVDGGVAKTEWVKDMKGALIGGVVVMVMLQVFLLISGSIMKLELGNDNITNMIYRSIIMGVGASTILAVTKNVLKYFGCDDQLLGTVGQFTAGRAFGAVKRGVSSMRDRVKNRAGRKAAIGGGTAEPSTSTQDTLMIASDRVATMRKSAMDSRRSARAVTGGNGTVEGGKAMPSGSMKSKQTIEKTAKVSDSTKGHTYSSPTKAVKASSVNNDITAKASPVPAENGNSTKSSELDKKKLEVKDLKPVKLDIKLKDGKLNKAIEKLGKQLEKANKSNKNNKKDTVAIEKASKKNKTGIIKIIATGDGKGLKVSKAKGPINQPLKIKNHVSSTNRVTNVVSGENRDNGSELNNIKRELALNKSRMQTVIDGQNKTNKRTMSLQSTLKKLNKKK